MQKPNRLLALLSYLLILIGPLLLILFRRKDKFTLYHACQSLALVGAAIAVPLLWLAIGWTFAFLSVEFPILYLVPLFDAEGSREVTRTVRRGKALESHKRFSASPRLCVKKGGLTNSLCDPAGMTSRDRSSVFSRGTPWQTPATAV